MMVGMGATFEAFIHALRSQYATRQLMQDAGLPTPKHCQVTSPQGLAEAGALVGFPAVIKPIMGLASFGVIRVNSQEELEAAYNRWVPGKI